jgi:hypothetical protein
MRGEETGLPSAFNGKPLVDPIVAEVFGKIQDLYASESHVVEQAVSRAHVGAAIPGAAAAIEDDEGRARQRRNASAQLLDTV